MSNSTPSGSSTPKSLDDIDFERFCHDLGLVDEVKKRAQILFAALTNVEEYKNEGTKSELLTCMVFTAIIDTRMPYGPKDPHLQNENLTPPVITVSELLKHGKLNVITFFERMRLIRDSIPLSEAVKYSLINLERKFCIVSPLFDRFEREWNKIFREERMIGVEMHDDSVPFSDIESVDVKKQLCWILFIYAKDKLLSENQMLVCAIYLLLCCLEYVLRSTPSFQLQPPFDVLHLQLKENLVQNGLNVAVLQKLAEMFHTNVDELSCMQNATEPFFQSLPHNGSEIDLVKLKQMYQVRYRAAGELDESLLLSHDIHLFPEKNRMMSSLCSGDSQPLHTPVRTALKTIQQLQNILSVSSDEPSSVLKSFFERCSRSPEASISSHLASFKVNFVDEFVKLAGSSLKSTGEQRYKQAKRLYFRVMEGLLNMEKERLGICDFSNLLNNDTFHRSLLACATEVVLMTYGVSWNSANGSVGTGVNSFSFPWILKVFNLSAYDFFRVLESFVKAEPMLTRDIVHHLQIVENQILDSLAWKEGSPLFEALSRSDVVSHGFLSPTRKNSPNSQATIPTAELFLSPKPESASSSSSQVSAISRPRSQSLNMFLSKVCRLGYHRLKALCDKLLVPGEVQQKIWSCFDYCISCKPELLKNRHIDQLMMCSLYGICKVTENEIKFKTIVQVYSMLPHAEQQTYKTVLIEGSETDTIIVFYNNVYMPNMKTFILQFASSKTTQPDLSPIPKSVSSSHGTVPSYSVPGHKHFYISPLRNSPFKAPVHSPGQMTPTTRQLYSFGEVLGSAEKLKNINETLSKMKDSKQTPKSLKRLNFDQVEGVEQCESPALRKHTAIIVKKKKLTPPFVTTIKEEPAGTSEDKDSACKESNP
ncbi:hypothetical protein CHS0354_007961 [Potamilus streckersoni]|uniref:Retinoblastoma-associated protein n=1 Tax=Potamilus streckersoni TaxID=2493646 RepID=A0AAE0S2F6_9BIVA|nr:hypothetical protein CHS0354_007961 [Potamilus streckersoni]